MLGGPDPEPPGVRWEADFDQALARALEEGRPIFLAVNALEDERANVDLATRLYPSAQWGAATRGYVCLVANPNDHPQAGGGCARYPGSTCAAHRRALAFVTERFGSALISPQHLILEPELDLHWRKEYYEPARPEEISPRNLALHLGRVTPGLAYRRAQIEREAQIAALVAAPEAELKARAEAWLGEPDPWAAAGVGAALDETTAPRRRLALLAALARAPAESAPVIAFVAEPLVLDPDAAPAEALAAGAALLAVDREYGVWALARVIARSKDAAVRARALALWSGGGGWRALPRAEQAPALEALLLGGEAVEGGAAPADPTPAEALRLARARRLGGGSGPAAAGLDPFPTAVPALRRALLAAAPEAVRAAAARVTEAFLRAPQERVRLAAGVALLRAGLAAPGLAEALGRALGDPVEGPELTRAVEEALGLEEGQPPALLAAALAERLGASR